jgi:hypothetical protein
MRNDWSFGWSDTRPVPTLDRLSQLNRWKRWFSRFDLGVSSALTRSMVSSSSSPILIFHHVLHHLLHHHVVHLVHHLHVVLKSGVLGVVAILFHQTRLHAAVSEMGSVTALGIISISFGNGIL